MGCRIRTRRVRHEPKSRFLRERREQRRMSQYMAAAGVAAYELLLMPAQGSA